ncbi:MAG: SAM-dependent methyltransferase [Alphaproteobacteria bacterium]|nr:MAG: SAM-dependent methyltransferase [Alphaproteobacteria bacterium]
MSLKKALDAVEAPFKITQEYSLTPYVNWSGNASKPIHRWYRYREAYSPDLITKLDLGARILDPFCGCGSIMIGAAELNRKSVGVDVNPLATFATKVKLTVLSELQRDRIKKFLETLGRMLKSADQWPAPGLSVAQKVFEPEILETVQKLRWLFETHFSEDEKVRDFVKLGWLSILEAVGSYYKEGNGIKYRNKKRKKGKYVEREEGVWQRERFGEDQELFVIQAFESTLYEMLDDTQNWKMGSWEEQEVYLGSSRELDVLPLKADFDSVIFSPPYANRFDYFEALKVELWFGNFVNSYEDAGALRKKSTRSHLGADYSNEARSFTELASLVKYMDKNTSSWKMGVEKLLYGYFDDMFVTLQKCKELLPSGSCHVVVGNSAFCGVIIPTDVLIAQLGLEAGFSQVEVKEARHLTVSPQQRSQLKGFERFMRESIVSFSV